MSSQYHDCVTVWTHVINIYIYRHRHGFLLRNSFLLSSFVVLRLWVVSQSDLSYTNIVSRCYNDLNFFLRLKTIGK